MQIIINVCHEYPILGMLLRQLNHGLKMDQLNDGQTGCPTLLQTETKKPRASPGLEISMPHWHWDPGSIPSGNLLQFAIENDHRNSGFTQL